MIDQGKKKKTSVNFVNILGVLRVIYFNPQQKKIVAVCCLLPPRLTKSLSLNLNLFDCLSVFNYQLINFFRIGKSN